MSFGKMNTFIDIIQTIETKDTEGFAISDESVVASVRAYMEERHGTKMWANRAVFSTANVLFRFRKIPNINITTQMIIVCGGERYKILSVEDVRGRGMYIEVLAQRMEASKNG